VKENHKMASIIIDEIVPTKWRLRLRDPEGKTREVEVRAGTPVQLDVDAVPDTSKKSEKPPTKVAQEKPRADVAEKPRATDKPRAEPADKARTGDKSRATDKPRVDAASKVRAADKPRADRTEKGTRTRTADETPTPAKTGRAAIEEKPAPEPPSIRRRKPEPGPGPGGLVWEPIDDDGVPGIRAAFERGAFKILHAGGDAHGLFYEWNSGKYQTLQCGPLDALKQAAARWTEDGKLQAPRSNLGAEAAKLACATPDEPAVPKAETVKDEPPASKGRSAAPKAETVKDEPVSKDRPPAPSSSEAPPVDPEKDKVLMQGFEASVQKLLAARKGAT